MNPSEAIRNVFQAVVDLDIDNVPPRVQEAIQVGAVPYSILNEGLSAGVRVVGERFESGEFYLTDLVLAGEVMKQGLAVLQPYLATADVQSRGTILLATVKGDIHEIGKNLVAMMLRAAGFNVIDLGVDVPTERTIAAVRQHKADIVGLSVLLTPMVAEIQNVLDGLTEAGLRSGVKVILGGACTTPALAQQMGCDAHGADAVSAVRICQNLLAAG
jgi:5-methyltetrahydrofolate--homocysteine methyltransferase